MFNRKSFKKFIDNAYSLLEPLFKEPKKHLKTWLVILGVLVASWAVAFFLRSPEPTQASWWNETWLYRRAIQISNDNGEDLEDFQVAITLDTASLITDGKLQNDCSDLRITDINGRLIPHWIEENNPGCNDAATKVWTKVPTVYDGTDATTVYVYYGNSQANNVESGDNVFEFFDNGESGGFSSKWVNVNGSGGSYSSDDSFGGANSVKVTGSDAVIASINDAFTNAIFEAQVKATSNMNMLTAKTSKTENTFYGFRPNYSGNADLYKRIQGNFSYLGSATSADYSTWASWKIVCNGTSIKTYYNDTIKHSVTDSDISSGGIGSRNGGGTTYLDNVMIRQYASSDPTTSLNTEEISPGPVAYWKFDEGTGTTAYDSSGQGNDGTLGTGSSAPTWQTEDMCVSGKCLYFDGSDDYVEVNGFNDYNLQPNFTISFWVNPVKEGVTQFFLSKDKYSYLRIGTFGTTGGKVYVQFRNDSEEDTNWHWYGGEAIRSNTWTHILITNSSSNCFKGYINGKSVSSVCFSGAFKNNLNRPLHIGRESSSFFNGFIDEVKIYPYTRTEEQILTDYNSGLSRMGSTKGSSVAIGGGEANLSDGLVGYWKMDESSWDGTADEVIDSSGNGNHGQGVGATSPTIGAGKFGNGGVFDGNNDHIDLGNDSSLSPSSQITIAGWYKLSSLNNNWAISKWKSGDCSSTHSSYLLAPNYPNNTSGKVWFFLCNGTDSDSLSSSNQLDPDQWYHLVATFEPGIIRIYIDGELNNEKSTELLALNTEAIEPLIFGQESSKSNIAPFHGYLDEVRIYNRTLSPDEVKALYEWAPGPVAHYTFDEGSGGSVYDRSGYGNNGTWSGTGTHWGVGKYGGAGVFNGSDDRVNVESSNNLNVKNITISMWISPVNDTQDMQLFDKYKTGPGGYAASTISGYIYFVISGESGTRTERYGKPPTGTWTHVSLVYDGISMAGYYNGIKQNVGWSSGSTGGPIITSPENFWIGQRLVPTYKFFNGLIDDVRIYNYARTQKQILEDMQGSMPGAARMPQSIAHWRFDEGYGTTANNSGFGGSSLSGTLGAGDSAPGWTNEGRMGKALSFDGSNDYVSSPTNSMFNISQNGFTYSVWIKGNNFSSNPMIMGRYLPYLRITAARKAHLSVHDGTQRHVYSNTSLNTGEWYHILATYDSYGYMKIYINGVLDGTAGPYSTLNNYGHRMSIGTWQDAGGSHFNGLIDEVKIYNYALSEEEVRQDYNQGMAAVMGQSSGNTGSTAPGGSASQEYCVPGSSDTCRPPVAEWKFDEKTGDTAYDTSGNNNEGTLVNNPTWRSTAFCKEGGCLEFDEESSYVNNSNFQGVDNSSSLTICSWVYLNSLGATDNADDGGIFCQDGSPTTALLWYNVNSDGSAGNHTYSFNVGDAGNSGNRVNGTDNAAIAKKWQYICGVMDESSRNLYIDGILNASVDGASATAVTLNNTSARIGSWESDSNLYFNGLIDQVRIYDYARTPAQIAWDYNRGGPVGHWRFDECQGTIAYDVSGNANHGTINIGATAPQTSVGTCASENSAHAWYNGREGKINSGISLDGIDDYITRDLSVSGTNATISFWVKNPAQGAGVYLLRSNANVRTYFTVSSTNINFYKGDPAVSIASFSVPPGNTWSHLVMKWWNEGSTLYGQAYLNGQALDSPKVFTNSNNGGYITLGGFTQSGTQNASGTFDDLRYFNYALTNEQVKLLYNDGAVRFQ